MSLLTELLSVRNSKVCDDMHGMVKAYGLCMAFAKCVFHEKQSVLRMMPNYYVLPLGLVDKAIAFTIVTKKNSVVKELLNIRKLHYQRTYHKEKVIMSNNKLQTILNGYIQNKQAPKFYSEMTIGKPLHLDMSQILTIACVTDNVAMAKDIINRKIAWKYVHLWICLTNKSDSVLSFFINELKIKLKKSQVGRFIKTAKVYVLEFLEDLCKNGYVLLNDRYIYDIMYVINRSSIGSIDGRCMKLLSVIDKCGTQRLIDKIVTRLLREMRHDILIIFMQMSDRVIMKNNHFKTLARVCPHCNLYVDNIRM